MTSDSPSHSQPQAAAGIGFHLLVVALFFAICAALIFLMGPSHAAPAAATHLQVYEEGYTPSFISPARADERPQRMAAQAVDNHTQRVLLGIVQGTH